MWSPDTPLTLWLPTIARFAMRIHFWLDPGGGSSMIDILAARALSFG